MTNTVEQILVLIAERPNVRTKPRETDLRGDFDEWFDGGAMKIETGQNVYCFENGAEAVVPTGYGNEMVDIKLADGKHVVARLRGVTRKAGDMARAGCGGPWMRRPMPCRPRMTRSNGRRLQRPAPP